MKIKDYTVDRKPTVSVSVKYSSAVDLLLSLWIINESACGSPLTDLDTEDAFFENLLDGLDDETKALLEPIPSGGTWIGLLTLLPEAGEGQSVAEFVSFLEQYDPVDLRHKLIMLYQDFDDDARQLAADAAEGVPGSVDALLDLPAFTTEKAAPWKETLKYLLDLESAETSALLVNVLRKVQDQSFGKYEPEFREFLEADYRSKRSMARRLSPERLVELASNGISVEDRHVSTPIVLMPSMVARPWVVMAEASDVLIMAYPVSDRTLLSDPDAPPGWLVKVHKALGDERRMRILRRLADGESSLAELAEGTDIAKSTLHHHMMLLRAAGLVKVNLGSDKKYALRRDTLPEAATYLNHYIYQSSDLPEETS